MKLGVSTACFYPLETEVSLENLGKAGIKHTEIFFNAMCELKQSFVDMLLDIQSEYGITVASIHPTMSLAESFMIFSNYDRRYREAEEQFRRYSEIAASLGAKHIILHGGKPNGILTDEEYCERYMQLKEITRENGVDILQENVVRFRAGEIEFLRSMKKILGEEAEFCIDLKQSIRCGYDPYELIDEFFDNIKHYHISDHSISSDCLLPGDGGFDFKKFFSVLKAKEFKGSCIIEVYKDCYDSYQDIYNSFAEIENLCCNIFENKV